MAKTKLECWFSIFIYCNLVCDQGFSGRTGRLVAWFTWKHFQALDYLTTPGLHGNPVITHQQRKHDQGHKLAGVGLQGTESERQSVCDILMKRVMKTPAVWWCAQSANHKNTTGVVITRRDRFSKQEFSCFAAQCCLQRAATISWFQPLLTLANLKQMRNGRRCEFQCPPIRITRRAQSSRCCHLGKLCEHKTSHQTACTHTHTTPAHLTSSPPNSLPVPSSLCTFGGLPCLFRRFN